MIMKKASALAFVVAIVFSEISNASTQLISEDCQDGRVLISPDASSTPYGRAISIDIPSLYDAPYILINADLGDFEPTIIRKASDWFSGYILIEDLQVTSLEVNGCQVRMEPAND
jgi:hypothetical protein